MQIFTKFLIIMVLSVFIGLTSHTNVFSQNSAPGPGSGSCVKCVSGGIGWLCMAGDQGGEACITEGANCTMVNPCVGGFCSNSSVLSKEKVELQIGDNLILEVGKVDPRLALNLISLRKIQRLNFSEGRISSAPIEMTLEDVTWQLKNSDFTKEYSAQLKQRMIESFDKGLLPTVYTFKIEKDSIDENSLLLSIQNTESGSIAPAHSSLEVRLSVTKSASRNSNNPENKLKAISWAIK